MRYLFIGSLVSHVAYSLKGGREVGEHLRGAVSGMWVLILTVVVDVDFV